MAAFGNLILDTTSPAKPILSLGVDGLIQSATNNTLSISSSDTDVYNDGVSVGQMKVWGYKGETRRSFTADGSTDAFTLTDKPDSINSVSVNGADLTTGDFSYDSSTGVVTLDSVPSADDVVVIAYTKDSLIESDVDWEPFATTKTVNFPAVDTEYTVSVRIRDDVYNESQVETVTVTLDTTAPVVAIVSGPTPNKISKVNGKNMATIVFSVDEDFVEYKVCVVANSLVAANAATAIGTANGSQNMSGTGTFSHLNNITSVINGADLEIASPTDGQKVIKIFVKDTNGIWSA